MNETTETTALAAPSDTALWMAQAKQLAARVPVAKRDDVLMLARPTPGQLIELVERLPANSQEKMMELVRKTRPKKQGAHGNRQGFSPTQVRLYQGTGNDPLRPAKMSPGEFYSTDSRVLGDHMDVVVLGYYMGRTLWPARDSGEKNPVCWSWDREVGSRYGECAKCPNASKRYTDGGCAMDVTFWFMDLEMSGIYSLTFAKTSYGAGTALEKVITKSENLWDRVIRLEAQERTNEKKERWYVIKASPLADPKNPQVGYTDKALRPMYEALSKVLDADVFYPALADVYDRSKGNADATATATGGEAVDEAALLGNTATNGDNPDFSVDT
jgi:hypothetical protein